MSDMERIFSDFDNADPASVGGRSENISTPGTFVVEVEAVKCKKSDQYDAIYLIVEFKVLESSTETVAVGRSYAWVHNLLNKFYGAANCKQFISAALGMSPTSPEARKITRDAVEEAWSDSQPLTGETVRLATSVKETKAGNPFTTHSWSPAV